MQIGLGQLLEQLDRDLGRRHRRHRVNLRAEARPMQWLRSP
jgi:hypothetical protein